MHRFVPLPPSHPASVKPDVSPVWPVMLSWISAVMMSSQLAMPPGQASVPVGPMVAVVVVPVVGDTEAASKGLAAGPEKAKTSMPLMFVLALVHVQVVPIGAS